MRVTAIKGQIRNTERVSIHVDGKYAFSLTQSQLLDHKLFVGKELDQTELDELKKSSDYGKLLERVMNYIMIRPRSMREVRDYLWRKKADPDASERVTSYFASRGYLDDAAFAKSWVRARQLTKPVSKRRLTAELHQKGVADELIRQALGEDEYDEAQALQEIITKKQKQARYQDPQKLMQYLARQGFSYDMIKNSLAKKSDE
jgi:regulatory protein